MLYHLGQRLDLTFPRPPPHEVSLEFGACNAAQVSLPIAVGVDVCRMNA